ncbi:MAG: hypothetical protein AB7I27_11680 [Bacteriovoracaceae bacterium]
MKTGILIVSTLISFSVQANPGGGLAISAMLGTRIANECPEMTQGCRLVASMAGLSATAAVALLKEMKQVQLDALAYESGDELSVALESVVAKLQDTAIENGTELSFEEAIAAINNLM